VKELDVRDTEKRNIIDSESIKRRNIKKERFMAEAK